jgi:hypothetical protein
MDMVSAVEEITSDPLWPEYEYWVILSQSRKARELNDSQNLKEIWLVFQKDWDAWRLERLKTLDAMDKRVWRVANAISENKLTSEER